MSAIFGYLGQHDDRLLATMSNAIEHRTGGPFRYIETTGGTLAYRPPPCAEQCQGGLAESNGVTLAFAGRVRTATDGATEIAALLAEQYRLLGLGFIEALQGDFVCAILDGEQLHLCRDGAGARSVYFAKHEGRFFFSVEPKGLWTLPGFSKRIRPAGIARYFSFSFQPTTETLLEDLWQTPAGHVATLSRGSSPRFTRTFRFEEAESARPDPNPDHWVGKFRQALGTAVEKRIDGRRDVIAFLSGGIDSSIVVHEAAARLGSELRTFALHFGEDYPDELEFARMVADRCGTTHEEVLVRPKSFLPRLRQMVWQLDDPIGDPVTIGNFELAKTVSGSANAVLNGEGGDPCYGGPKNLPMLLQHWYGGARNERGFRERLYLESYRRGYHEFNRLLTPDWQRLIDPQEDLEAVLTPFFEASRPASFLNKLMAINVRLKGAQLILPKVERLLGGWGLQPLSPLFDENLVRLSFEMPPQLKLSRGVEKWVLKQAYRDDLPNEIVDRPKSGMRVPVHFWFQGELKRYAKSLLSEKNIRRAGLFNPERVRQLLRYEAEERDSRHGLLLWMLITFEIWRQIVVEGETV